jgi:predicted acetyltransferase
LLERPIRVGDAVLRAIGVVDVCVATEARSRGIAGRLLEEALALAARSRFDVAVLFADDHRLYQRHGFHVVDNPCSWLRIDEHRTLGVAEPVSLRDSMMVRRVGDATWPAGPVDLLGHLW